MKTSDRAIRVLCCDMLPMLLVAALTLHAGTIERISCADAPEQTYDLFLPSAYHDKRSWPVLYALDARGRTIPAERFKHAAEKYGYVVVAVNGINTDGPFDPNLAAFSKVWNDTHRRLSLDDKRVYYTGFSGGSRTAFLCATLSNVRPAGVIGVGAAFHYEFDAETKIEFSWFGAAGTEDFNYTEMIEASRELSRRGVPHTLELFSGGHEWLPERGATRAIEWLELDAMRRGLADKNMERASSIALQWVADAESEADPLASRRLLERAIGSLDRLGADASAVRTKLRQLEATPSFRAARKEEEKSLAWEKREVARTQPIILRAIAKRDQHPSEVAKAINAAALNRQAEGKGPMASAATRILSTLVVQTGHYMPIELVNRKDYAGASFLLRVASEISPKDPGVWYFLAAVAALQNDARNTAAHLEKAIANGFSNRARFTADNRFDGVRDEPVVRKAAQSLY